MLLPVLPKLIPLYFSFLLRNICFLGKMLTAESSPNLFKMIHNRTFRISEHFKKYFGIFFLPSEKISGKKHQNTCIFHIFIQIPNSNNILQCNFITILLFFLLEIKFML